MKIQKSEEQCFMKVAGKKTLGEITRHFLYTFTLILKIILDGLEDNSAFKSGQKPPDSFHITRFSC